MNTRFLFPLALLAFVFVAPVRAGAGMVVVEFFTSQGCSMCIPVARVMEEIAPEQDLLVLTWNVDYWDYMGWKDTLASPENTARQEAYNRAIGHKGVFTPQLIINGESEVSGIEKQAILRDIKSAKGSSEAPYDVAFTGSLEDPWVRIEGPEAPSGARVVLVWYNTLEEVKVSGGENAGRTIIYAHPVRSYKTIAEWNGELLEIPLDLSDPDRNGADCIAVLVQAGEAGPILGAAKIRLQ